MLKSGISGNRLIIEQKRCLCKVAKRSTKGMKTLDYLCKVTFHATCQFVLVQFGVIRCSLKKKNDVKILKCYAAHTFHLISTKFNDRNSSAGGMQHITFWQSVRFF